MRRSWWRRPEALLPLTFLAAIVAGTGALLLPGMASDRVGPLEAFFTSTSAVCVTGLIVVDTGRDFSLAGQAVICVLIQLGGLGIMTFSVFALVIAGRRVSLGNAATLRETYSQVAHWRVGRLVGAIVLMTFAFELAGFLALRPALGATWPAVFHSVSAFCNAGFSLYPGSLQGFGPGAVLPVMFLFILGGLGFTTILELARSLVPRRAGTRRFSLHARLTLVTTLVLWGAGALLLFATEGGGFGDALFMSATARTAGFDTIPVGSMSGASLLVLIPLMFVGASPGSTGGGIKTTNLALIVLVAWATLRGHEQVVVHGREIPRRQVRRMFAILASSLLVVFLAIFGLHVLEGDHPETVLGFAFEAVSAFGTVGLSTGITPALTGASKLLLCLVMFIGRVGSLSLFVLLVRDASPSQVRYPEERVIVG